MESSENPGAWPPANRLSRRRFLGGLAVLGGALLVPSRAFSASTSRGERRISFVHTHTGERFSTTYWGDGAYLDGELARVDDFLRDFRTGERYPIDPTLLDELHELALATGTRAPFQVVSAYRSPSTNAELRATRGGQASHSLHMTGQAIDFRLADVSTASIRDAALDLRRGGEGYYPGSDFVHVDTGRVRHW